MKSWRVPEKVRRWRTFFCQAIVQLLWKDAWESAEVKDIFCQALLWTDEECLEKYGSEGPNRGAPRYEKMCIFGHCPESDLTPVPLEPEFWVPSLVPFWSPLGPLFAQNQVPFWSPSEYFGSPFKLGTVHLVNAQIYTVFISMGLPLFCLVLVMKRWKVPGKMRKWKTLFLANYF